MEKKTKTKIQWILVLGTACTWFGQHCGAGFASGAQVTKYFATSGWKSIFMTLIPFVILGVVMYLMSEYVRRTGARGYKDVALNLYSQNSAVGRVMLFVWDISLLLNIFISGGAVVAGCSTLLNQTLGIPYVLASVLFASVVALICMFGAKVMARISLGIVSVLIAALCIVAFALLSKNWSYLGEILGQRQTFGASSTLTLTNTIFYVGIGSTFIVPLTSMACEFKSKQDSKVMAISGALMNGLTLLFVTLAVLTGMPAAMDSNLPVLDMLNANFSSTGPLAIVYQLALFLAYLTMADVFAAIQRYGAVINKKGKFNQAIVDGILCVLFLLCAILIAQFGLKALVDKGYKIQSFLRIPLYVVCTLIFVPIRLHQMKKKKRLAVQDAQEEA